MREYNLNEYTVVNAKGYQETTNTPAESDKALTVRGKQGKIISEVSHFWNREIEFPELRNFLQNEMNMEGIKNMCNDGIQGLKEVKNFWCEDIMGTEEKYKYID